MRLFIMPSNLKEKEKTDGFMKLKEKCLINSFIPNGGQPLAET
jgi:hypothetical protein